MVAASLNNLPNCPGKSDCLALIVESFVIHGDSIQVVACPLQTLFVKYKTDQRKTRGCGLRGSGELVRFPGLYRQVRLDARSRQGSARREITTWVRLHNGAYAGGRRSSSARLELDGDTTLSWTF